MVSDKFSLAGKVAIVTGSGRGIGKGIALAFAEAGADVACCARTVSEIETSVKDIRAKGRRALAIRCDVTDEDQVQKLVDETVREFGRIDILVNNAGGTTTFGPMVRMSRKDFEKTLALNLIGPFLCSKAAARVMLKQESGVIINISTRDSIQPCIGRIAYGAAKAGVNSLTKTLAWELSPHIRVNGILVGGIATEGVTVHLEPFLKQIVDGTPMKRMGLPEDIAMACVYLASDASNWVTGRMFEIDGGIEFVRLDLGAPFGGK
ncbi:MAG: 3-oxoacyl-ACP reductase FabG [Chloroflexi bacterium]|nr:3-oxoacyl-ACP reductase FabG [Chloroflexota bacterium]